MVDSDYLLPEGGIDAIVKIGVFVMLFPFLWIMAIIHGLISLDIFFLGPLWLFILAIVPWIGWLVALALGLMQSGAVFSMWGIPLSKNKSLRRDDMFCVTIAIVGILATTFNAAGWLITFLQDQGLKASDLDADATYRETSYGWRNVVAFGLYAGAGTAIIIIIYGGYIYNKLNRLLGSVSEGNLPK